MKIKKIISILLIILILYLYENKQTNYKIIDYKSKFTINYFNNIIYSNHKNLTIGDTLTNNINTYNIIDINKNYVIINQNFIGNPVVYLNAIKKEIPNNIKAIHTIDIYDNIIPKQLYINKNEIVKWKNKTDHSIIFNLEHENIILLKKIIQPETFHIFVFDKSGTYTYFSNDSYNSIIVH